MVTNQHAEASKRKHQLPSCAYRKVFISLSPPIVFVSRALHLHLFSFLFTADINELNLPKTCAVEFPDPDDLLNFKLIMSPDEGFYRDGRFVFNFRVGSNYPHEPPKVKCGTQVYHPNIDLDGNVCLNILREDWNPVLTINSVVYGLQFLFLEPNPEDPLNKEAADVLQSNRRQFEYNVKKAMRGGCVGETFFECCLK
ncbi:hypothetical protein KR093_008111 [Drosophila rubida]|uniref:E2 NEDD8-conjugating enzyme n=1 Tax=Drosophila rubida TaxID=30044 RepID=A0AAD4PJL8_9MUSC|nr:hypothetical protein KR093_008111 [Drosophila rubida]